MSHIKDLRRSIPDLTQLELSKLSMVSRHSVLRLEQLVYPTPLPNVVATLSEITGISEWQIEIDYARDVIENRGLSGTSYFSDHAFLISQAKVLADRYGEGSTVHNFKKWREYVMIVAREPISAIHFCQLTSIHPATLSRYEAFRTGFPSAIGTALLGCGIPQSLIDYFCSSTAYNVKVTDD